MSNIISEFAKLQSDLKIGQFNIIKSSINAITTIQCKCEISNYVFIDEKVVIENDVFIDNYCQILFGSKIGEYSKILYKAQIYENVTIGKRCIISGSVADKTIIEDDVTFMGIIVHSYRNPGTDWDWDNGEAQPSPIIRSGSVIGENAILVGGISIGNDCYIAAGEILRCSLPDEHVFYKGKISKLKDWHGVIKPRIRQ